MIEWECCKYELVDMKGMGKRRPGNSVAFHDSGSLQAVLHSEPDLVVAWDTLGFGIPVGPCR